VPGLPAPGAAGAAAPAGPQLRLIAAQRSITLDKFLKLTVRNSTGKVAATETIPFCPNTYDPERTGPASPRTTPYPQQCPTNPFALSMVWGVQKGWATDPAETNFLGHQTKLPLGVYQVTGTITPEYTRLFHIPARDATTTVKVTVVKGPRCCPIPGCCLPGRPNGPRGHAPPRPPANVPTMDNPPSSALPDLVALPAW
jgi:hypothetical protein